MVEPLTVRANTGSTGSISYTQSVAASQSNKSGTDQFESGLCQLQVLASQFLANEPHLTSLGAIIAFMFEGTS